ncbi:MAG TPA: isoprenylcysteine carboxylmethyltransferase family protein [Usitatibacter sp.]|nr:isoprenylcysteine carboxylmethyltransferase family protein [Usitatibacter sp.]
MGSLLMVTYSIGAYLFFIATFVYTVGFLGGLPLPKNIDGGTVHPLAGSIGVDLLLLAIFAVQHSVMARPAFKARWTRIVPPPLERSTFVLASTCALALLLWQWRPIPSPVLWDIHNTPGIVAVYGLFALGWAVLLLATFLINHFELFGLWQPVAHAFGQRPSTPHFQTPMLYRFVRHPLYLGFLIAFWSTPHMSAGHLLFALGATGYIFIGIFFEERDLVAQFGERYRAYREKVGMILPLPR